MIFPLRRIAVGFSWLAVSVLFLGASLAPSPVDAQTKAKSVKRAVPPAKARAKAASRNTSSSWVANPGVTAKDAYLIVDATSGRELASDRADELRHPASVTKLMTIYLTFRHWIRAGCPSATACRCP